MYVLDGIVKYNNVKSMFTVLHLTVTFVRSLVNSNNPKWMEYLAIVYA